MGETHLALTDYPRVASFGRKVKPARQLWSCRAEGKWNTAACILNRKVVEHEIKLQALGDKKSGSVFAEPDKIKFSSS
jgi:hypothetical protein